MARWAAVVGSGSTPRFTICHSDHTSTAEHVSKDHARLPVVCRVSGAEDLAAAAAACWTWAAAMAAEVAAVMARVARVAAAVAGVRATATAQPKSGHFEMPAYLLLLRSLRSARSLRYARTGVRNSR